MPNKRLGGLPSLLSLTRKFGQLQRPSASMPRGCSLGTQPSVFIVESQEEIVLIHN